jgi:hypothetical protein
MRTICLLLLVWVGFSYCQTVTQGVPGDQANCVLSDGTYLYQGSNTDPAKIIKIRISDLERVAEYIVPFDQGVTFLCPGTFDAKYQNMYFVGHIGSKRSSEMVILKIDTAFSNPSITGFGAPSDTFTDMFADASNLYLVYSGQFGTQVARLRLSDLILDNIAPIDNEVVVS